MSDHVLTRNERLWYALVGHRRFIGWVVSLFGMALVNKGAFLGVWQPEISTAITALGTYISGAGTHKSDEWHSDKRDELIRSRSGQFPAFNPEMDR